MHPRIHTRVRIHVILRVRHDVLVPCVCRHVRAIFIQEIILNVPQINESRPSCVSLRRSGTNRRDISRWRRFDRSVHHELRRIPVVRTNRTNLRYRRKILAEMRASDDRRGRSQPAPRFSQLLSEIKLGSRSFTPLRFTHIKFIHRIIDIYVIKHVQHIPRISYQPRVAC